MFSQIFFIYTIVIIYIYIYIHMCVCVCIRNNLSQAVPVGINIAGCSYYSTEWHFINSFRCHFVMACKSDSVSIAEWAFLFLIEKVALSAIHLWPIHLTVIPFKYNIWLFIQFFN